MKLPRDLSSTVLIRLLGKYGYQVARQKGSHIRLTTLVNGEHHITVPCHDAIRVGTLRGILDSVAAHAGIDRDELMQNLFG